MRALILSMALHALLVALDLHHHPYVTGINHFAWTGIAIIPVVWIEWRQCSSSEGERGGRDRHEVQEAVLVFNSHRLPTVALSYSRLKSTFHTMPRAYRHTRRVEGSGVDVEEVPTVRMLKYADYGRKH